MFELKIKTGNAAFSEDPEYEISRILREIARNVNHGRTNGMAIDINGNEVGEWRFSNE